MDRSGPGAFALQQNQGPEFNQNTEGYDKRRKISPRSIQYVMQITRQAWNVAMNNNVTISPFPKITLEKFDNNRIRFMTDDEIKTGIPFRSAGGGVFTKREKRLCYRLTILLCCI